MEEGTPSDGSPEPAGGVLVQDAVDCLQPPLVRKGGPHARSISELQGVMKSEWSDFRHRINSLLLQQSSRQEAILARCLEDLSPGTWQVAGNQAGLHPESNAFPGTSMDLPPVVESGQALASRPGSSRLRALSSNIQQITPRGRSRERPDNGSHSRRSESLGSPSDLVRGEVLQAELMKAVPHLALSAAPSAVDHAVIEMQATVAQLEGAVRRMESLLLKQQSRAAERLQSRQEWLSEADTLAPRPCFSRVCSPGSSCSTDEENFQPRRSNLMESARGATKTWPRVVLEKRFSSCFDWWENLEVPQPTGRLASFVLSKQFELMCAVVIIVNAIFTWHTTNYEIRHLQLSSSTAADVLEGLFVCFYVGELSLKLVVHRQYFFCNHDMQWNIFDFTLVIFALTDQVMTTLSKSKGPVDKIFMRVLRILRMAKILRGLRVMRFFSELRLMLNSLIGSMQSLMWSIVMLALIFYVFGLVFVQGAAQYIVLNRESMEQVEVDRILQELGSVEGAMLAMYRSCTGGEDWTYFYNIILTTGAAYAGLFIFFIAFSQVAFLNILTAIFVNRALELAKPDKDTEAMLHWKKQMEAYSDLQALCRLMDTEGTGKISVDEFERQLENGRLGARLSILGLNVTDAAHFFSLLLSSNSAEADEVSCADFVEGCMRMRGMATGIGLQNVDKTTRLLTKSLRTLQKDLNHKFTHLTQAIQKLLLDPSDGSCPPHPCTKAL